MTTPQTTQISTDSDVQAASDDAPIAAETAARVHPVELSEAPPDVTTAPAGQLDVLLDMDVPVTVILGSTQIPVRRLLQLGPGSVLKLDKALEAPADLYLKDSKFAEADVVVVDNRFAVRVRQIVKAAADEPMEG